MLIWNEHERKLYALNGSGRAPQGMTPELFADQGYKQIPERGPLTINVPGAVDGWFQALERIRNTSCRNNICSGELHMLKRACRSRELSGWLNQAAEPVLRRWESSAGVYLPDNRLPKTGDLLRQPNLAKTYRMLAKEGRDAFYKGPIAREITSYIQQNGGVLDLEDMQKHHSDWVEPISTNYRGYDVFEFPPNSQGLTALEMLNIIEGYN